MTANPDSALRQALDALAPFAELARAMDDDMTILQPNDNMWAFGVGDFSAGDLRRAREAHALITEALQRGEKT